MADVKLAVIFYTTYGTNHAMAEAAADAAREAGAEVRLLKVRETVPQDIIDGQEGWKAQQEKMADIPEVSPEDMEWANAYLFSAPTRYGNVASQMRAFIDTLGPLWQDGKLANKPVSAMTSTMTDHGGQESTLLAMHTTFMHWGSIIVPNGYTDPSIFEFGGNPYGYSQKAGEISPEGLKVIQHQGRRIVDVARKMAS
ncbi:NAD(P)H:quinone oxidoreductase [Tropicimonas sp. IMCC34011]|uniref:NAD(P)H:quinone oxidoreductase n=1 Tax=Tropicimonas sp. IMCC34011 TaxID=2248759 RepID=UPI000E2797B0|nr:NAD(P)H:quinone oxidoreductase [Tropicimonas sp. IMCC34011]